MADQVLGKMKGKVVLFSIIGQEIKAVREKAMLLHQKRLDQAEANFQVLLEKKTEKFRSEKLLLAKKVEKYESENRRYKEALGAARVQLLGLAEREADVVALKKKLNEAENRIQMLHEKEKEDIFPQQNGNGDLLSRSSLPSGNQVEASELIDGHPKVITGDKEEVDGTKTSPSIESIASIASRTRGRKRKGGEANAKKEVKKSLTKSGEDLTDVGTLDTLESSPTTELELKLKYKHLIISSSTNKPMSREGKNMTRSQGYMADNVSNILEAYQHVITKTPI